MLLSFKLRFVFLSALAFFPALAEPADAIYSARYVVTMDPARRVIENGAVAVRGQRIAGLGTQAEIARRFISANHLDRPDAILMPGLINTHTHAAMSLFRGIADDRTLQDWLQNYIFPAEKKNLTPDFVSWGTRLACLEMMLSGTTTFTDMYYFEDRVAEAAKEAGMRGVLGESVIGFPVADAKSPADALRFAEGYIRRYRNDALVIPAVAPHALYTNSDADLKAARELANRYDVPLLIHLSETRRENEDTAAKRGMSPTAVLENLGVLKGRTVVAHGVWLSDSDIAILKATGTGVAHCPSSNMKLASGIAPVLKLLSAGIPTGLGTDGPAGSNNDFNLFEEINLAANLQKVSSGDARALPAVESIAMATILGARALGMEKEIGSLEPGKRADFITVSLSEPHAVPMYNVYSQIAYALKGSDVLDVVVNGKLIVRQRHSLTLSSATILAKAKEYKGKVATSLHD